MRGALRAAARHASLADGCCALPPPRRQAGFKRDLIREVRAFVADAQAFRRDWDASGPMVAGLDPMEAMDRLRKFQQMFEVRLGRGGGGLHACMAGAQVELRRRWQAVKAASKRARPVSTQPSRRNPQPTADPQPRGACRSASASGPTTAAARSCLACR